MRRRTLATGGALAGVAAGVAAGLYGLVVRGALTLDLGIGRTLQTLGPLTVRVKAPRDVVFEVIAGPYLRRTPRALEGKLRVLERGHDLVLAEHYTPLGPIVAKTVETVRFERPSHVYFRLLRGPVPYVVERFELTESAGGTELEYHGQLGTDFWAVGRWWGRLVARRWVATVRGSLEGVKAEAERQARQR